MFVFDSIYTHHESICWGGGGEGGGVMVVGRGANSQISWGGAKFFLAWEKFFFALSCQKLRISTPYWKQFMYWNVIKFDMLVHILNIESMKQIKKNFWESWGGATAPPAPPPPPNWRHWWWGEGWWGGGGGGGGDKPIWCLSSSQPSSLHWPPTGLAKKIHQKYMAPLWFYHKSSTAVHNTFVPRVRIVGYADNNPDRSSNHTRVERWSAI